VVPVVSVEVELVDGEVLLVDGDVVLVEELGLVEATELLLGLVEVVDVWS